MIFVYESILGFSDSNSPSNFESIGTAEIDFHDLLLFLVMLNVFCIKTHIRSYFERF